MESHTDDKGKSSNESTELFTRGHDTPPSSSTKTLNEMSGDGESNRDKANVSSTRPNDSEANA